MKKLLVLAGALLSATPHAQVAPPAATPSFEVASIKRNKSGDGFITMGMPPGGGMSGISP